MNRSKVAQDLNHRPSSGSESDTITRVTASIPAKLNLRFYNTAALIKFKCGVNFMLHPLLDFDKFWDRFLNTAALKWNFGASAIKAVVNRMKCGAKCFVRPAAGLKTNWEIRLSLK